MKRMGASVALVGFVACSTPYQSKGWLRGGYEETRLAPNDWLVKVEVNAYTSRSTAIEYTYRRAAELCPSGFDVIDADRSERRFTVRNFSGADEEVSKPNAVLVVRCKVVAQPMTCTTPSCQ